MTCFNALTVFIKRRLRGSAKVATSQALPTDVKEGCFVILAVDNEEPARFVVDLGVLKNPQFLRLLKLAEEEYGFRHEGALAIPCRPDHLKSILQDKIEEQTSFVH